MDTFSEARYYLNVNIIVIFDHHSNIIAAALGLETLITAQSDLRATKAGHATQSQCIGTMQTPTLEKPFDITEGLNVVVGEGEPIFSYSIDH